MKHLEQRFYGVFLCVFGGICMGMDVNALAPSYSHWIIGIILSLLMIFGGYLLIMFAE